MAGEDAEVALPVLLFASTADGFPRVYAVSFFGGTLVCDCGEIVCLHVEYTMRERMDNNDQIVLIPDSGETTRDEMEALINDRPRLRQWLLRNARVIDTDSPEWFEQGVLDEEW